MSTIFLPFSVKAWGPEGHAMIARLAIQFLTPEARQQVLAILATMPVDTAANWMDMMRSNSDYDFMKPWHYIDFDKTKAYMPSTDENIINRIIITFNELKHKKVLCNDQIRTDLLILLHLIGDLSQPLHTGYDDDLGGNKLALQYDTLKTSLHKFWDEEIIRLTKITDKDCMAIYSAKLDTIEGFQPVAWMYESRSLLNTVYDYQGFIVDNSYLNRSKKIVAKQLLVAAMRLAAALNKLFVADSPELNMKDAATKFKNGIDAKDALQYKGKNVTACGRVYGIKTTDKVTFINVGDKYPNSPLTVVIFAKDRKNFSQPIEELFANKNICIRGEVVEYQGKAEIIVTKPEDILIQ